MNMPNLKVSDTLDCSWLLCPVPILMTEERLETLPAGGTLEVIFTDPGAKPDLMAWCRATGNEFIACRDEKKRSLAYIRKNK